MPAVGPLFADQMRRYWIRISAEEPDQACIERWISKTQTYVSSRERSSDFVSGIGRSSYSSRWYLRITPKRSTHTPTGAFQSAVRLQANNRSSGTIGSGSWSGWGQDWKFRFRYDSCLRTDTAASSSSMTLNPSRMGVGKRQTVVGNLMCSLGASVCSTRVRWLLEGAGPARCW